LTDRTISLSLASIDNRGPVNNAEPEIGLEGRIDLERSVLSFRDLAHPLSIVRKELDAGQGV